MRMTRDAPPELDLGFPGPSASTSATDRPDSRSRSAVQLPKTPAPTTTQSIKRHSPAHRNRARVGQLRRGDIFHCLAERLEDRDFVFAGAARDAPRQHFPYFAGDAVARKWPSAIAITRSPASLSAAARLSTITLPRATSRGSISR